MDDEEGFSDEERPTLVTCMACGGHDMIKEHLPNGQYRVHMCRWCTRGAMSPMQMVAYRAYLKARDEKPK